MADSPEETGGGEEKPVVEKLGAHLPQAPVEKLLEKYASEVRS